MTVPINVGPSEAARPGDVPSGAAPAATLRATAALATIAARSARVAAAAKRNGLRPFDVVRVGIHAGVNICLPAWWRRGLDRHEIAVLSRLLGRARHPR